MSERAQATEAAEKSSPGRNASGPAASGLLQRQRTLGGDASGLTRKRAGGDGKRLSVNRNAAGHKSPGAVPPIVGEVLDSPGSPLDAKTRTFMESRFGHDFSRVRVHTDARASESARAIDAAAYTLGHDVVFGAGRYAPETAAGEMMIAHELAHVVQQEGVADAAPAAAPAALAVSSPTDPAEVEADAVAAKVASGESAVPSVKSKSVGRIQRAVPAAVGLGEVLGAIDVVLAGVGNSQGGLSWTYDQVTYPAGLERVGDAKTKSQDAAYFYSHGMFFDNETTFAMHGEFSDTYDPPNKVVPIMANVFITLEKNRSSYDESILSFNVRRMDTPYGTPEDPRIRFNCEGEFNPAGLGACGYRVVLEINKYAQVRAVESNLTSGDGMLLKHEAIGFSLVL